MTSKPEANEEDSFIILGTSPGTSLDLKCNGMEGPSLDRVALDDAMKDLSPEASTAFKAHFKLENGPSPTSLMVASTIITDDRSTEDLQKHFGELLDENVILKETLKKNNDSMKEQFLLIASCQEDMMRTHALHKEKFDETRELVEKLRQENKKLKLDIVLLAETEPTASAGSAGKSSGPPSALEFVTSPDDDTVNKLTSQLELVEKQRRQVIVENEKLTWQKESLEHIVDATSKERDDLKEKLKNLEWRLSGLESKYSNRIDILNYTIQDMHDKLEVANKSMANVSAEEITKRNEMINQLESKVAALQSDLKHAQLKILDLETVKLEFSKYKSGVADTAKLYKEQIQELHTRLKEAQTTVFQPVRFSISSEQDADSSEYCIFKANVKLYDKTLKHMAEFLNLITRGSVDTLVESLGVVASLHEFKLDRSNAEQVRSSLGELRVQLEKQHNAALSNIGQVKGTLSIFEGIFKDYNEILKKNMVTKQEAKPQSQSVEQLTEALVARGQEVQILQSEIVALRSVNEDRDLLNTQLLMYKCDFDAERQSREKMASEKDAISIDLRTTQRRNQELMLQLEEVRKLNPNIYRSATANKLPPAAAPPAPAASRRQSAPGTATGNMVYKCPKCNRFSSDLYKAMEEHFDFCLDDF